MLDAKMKLYQSPAKTDMNELETKFAEWEQLGRDLGVGGADFKVCEITRGIALSQLVPKEFEHQFNIDPERLGTFAQKMHYVRQRISDH